jgi:hypothetical protein
MYGPTTRRDFLANALAGLTGLLLGEQRRGTASSVAEGIPVEHLNLHLPHGRPVWEQRDLWRRAAARYPPVRVENEAVRLGPLDDPIGRNYNYHALALGGREGLQQAHAWFFGAVKRTCDFDWTGAWAFQEHWLEELFQRVFADAVVGWVSLLGARRPAQFREQQDPTIRVDQHDDKIRIASARPARYLDRFHLLEVGRLVMPTRGLVFAAQDPRVRTDGQVFATYVPRHVRSSRFAISNRYEEVWLCLARPEDRFRLRRGQIPAVQAARYEGRAIRVRTAPILNLVTVSPDRMSYTVVAVEINPDCGDVLSIRWNDMALAAGILCSSPVEHVGLCEAFRKLMT